MNATVTAKAEYKALLDVGGLIEHVYKLEIVDSTEALSEAVEFAIAAEGVTIAYDGDEENAHAPIISSSATFTLFAQTAAQVTLLETIAQADVGRFGVRFTTTKLVNAIPYKQLRKRTFERPDSNNRQLTTTSNVTSDDLGYLKK